MNKKENLQKRFLGGGDSITGAASVFILYSCLFMCVKYKIMYVRE